MIRIVPASEQWKGLQFSVEGKLVTLGEGIDFDSIPREIEAKVETYVKLKFISLVKKEKEFYEVPEESKKKGGK